MNWWWLDPASSPRESNEETDARTRICLMSGLFFILLFVPVYYLFCQFSEFHIAAFATFFATVPPSLYIGRRASEQLWPALLKKADANAKKRLKGQSTQ